MTLYCDVDGTLLDSSARHEQLLRDLLAERKLLWPDTAPDYLAYKADGHSTFAWLAAVGFTAKQCNEISAAWRKNIEAPAYQAMDHLYPDAIPFLKTMKKEAIPVALVSARQQPEKLCHMLERCGVLLLVEELIVVSPLHATEEKICALRTRVQPGDRVVGDTEADRDCAEALHLPYAMLDRGFRSKAYWKASGVQSFHDLTEVQGWINTQKKG